MKCTIEQIGQVPIFIKGKSMDKRIKQKWIDALLSGEYQQTRQQLFDGDGYCCLGVLCDLYRKEHKEHEWSHIFSEFEQKDKWEFLDQSETLPNDVIFWSGITKL